MVIALELHFQFWGKCGTNVSNNVVSLEDACRLNTESAIASTFQLINISIISEIWPNHGCGCVVTARSHHFTGGRGK